MINRRDRSAIVFVLIACVFLLGYRFNSHYINDYQSAYLRQTTPIIPKFMAGYNPPTASQQVIDLFADKRPPIPVQYSNLLDVEEYISGANDKEFVPFFWHVYRTGGGTMAQLLGECLRLTLASAFSFPIDSMFTSDAPRIIRYDNVKYLNVNLWTREGIQRAKIMDIVHEVKTDRGKVWVDAVLSPDLEGITGTLFSKKDRYSKPMKGAMFIMSRNPIEREISKFFSIQAANKKPGARAFTLSDWITAPTYNGNIMVRQLSGKSDPQVPVTMEDLLVAKEVLRRKCAIGLLEEKQESWRRIQKLYHGRWDLKHREIDEVCQDRMMNWGWKNRNSVKTFIDMTIEDELQTTEEGIVDKTTYKKIAAQNQLDLLLYEYTKHLFLEQAPLYEDPAPNPSGGDVAVDNSTIVSNPSE